MSRARFRPLPERALFWGVLVLALVLSPLIGLVTPYLIVLLAVMVFVSELVQGWLADVYREPVGRSFLLAVGLLGIAFVLSARSPGDVLYVFNFTMLLLYAPIAVVLRRGARPSGVQLLSLLCLAGTIVAFGMVAYAAWRGAGRPMGINLGPIVLSNAVLAMGFLSLAGAVEYKAKPLTALYLFGPILAVATVWLTQSRGPLLAVPLVLLAVAVFLWFGRLRNFRLPMIGAGLVLVMLAFVGAFMLQGRLASIFTVLGAMLRGEAVGDESTYIRLVFYRGGVEAFAESPFWGHGWGRLMEAIAPHVAEADRQYLNYPQLHNDVLDFAVAGGALGILAYALIVLTPITAAWRERHEPRGFARLYGIAVITLVYITGGLTDLMFGHEFHTALYVCLVAAVFGLCREPERAPDGGLV